MGVLSKPSRIPLQLLGSYLTNLYLNPIRTKSLTAAVIALLGNYTSQCLTGAKAINQSTLAAFGLYGLLFGGSIPHFFYQGVTKVVNENSRYAAFQMLLIERCLFMPLYQFFSLYMLARLEMKSHSQALGSALRFYFPILEANYKYLTLIQFINLYFVPPILRVLVNNMIGFFWVIFLAKKRSPPSRKSK